MRPPLLLGGDGLTSFSNLFFYLFDFPFYDAPALFFFDILWNFNLKSVSRFPFLRSSHQALFFFARRIHFPFPTRWIFEQQTAPFLLTRFSLPCSLSRSLRKAWPD